MKSRATPRSWAAYREVPTDIQGLARKAYRLFASNPQHQGLRVEKVHGHEPIYSARVALGQRALGLLEGDDITRYWIGAHADYERLLARL
ncbi:MAG: hypothetical protein F4Y47_08360 [Acidobacteriia bacterium]|nr:hypothetical protein [Terriglobia bacterium]MYG03943.1 hypothetical protein [Terriglobia bacterium]MYK10371.1 hypothetical protein [Terriglobia bacterium]